jgi:hypothetical protein
MARSAIFEGMTIGSGFTRSETEKDVFMYASAYISIKKEPINEITV